MHSEAGLLIRTKPDWPVRLQSALSKPEWALLLASFRCLDGTFCASFVLVFPADWPGIFDKPLLRFAIHQCPSEPGKHQVGLSTEHAR